MRVTSKIFVLCMFLCLTFELAACAPSNRGGVGDSGNLEARGVVDVSGSSGSQEVEDGASPELPSWDSGPDIAADASAEGEQGDVLSARGIAPLVVDGNPQLYTYEDLLGDVEALGDNYPDWVQIDYLGTTVDGRSLPHLVIGNPSAANQVLVHAGIHAREYITTQLVMKQVSAFLAHAAAGDEFRGVGYVDMLESNAVHVVPSVNPDGAAISQRGLDGVRTEMVRERLVEIAAMDGGDSSPTYFRNWKANANGVDLNRNFDAMWSDYIGSGHPSSERFKGVSPGCEVESAALIALTEDYRFTRTVSYHAYGSVVYWYFGQSGALYRDSERFAQEIADLTGYRLDADFQSLDPAGYKDWALQVMEIPSVTIEVGWGDAPVPPEQFGTIWLQNEHIWEMMLSS